MRLKRASRKPPATPTRDPTSLLRQWRADTHWAWLPSPALGQSGASPSQQAVVEFSPLCRTSDPRLHLCPLESCLPCLPNRVLRIMDVRISGVRHDRPHEAQRGSVTRPRSHSQWQSWNRPGGAPVPCLFAHHCMCHALCICVRVGHPRGN